MATDKSINIRQVQATEELARELAEIRAMLAEIKAMLSSAPASKFQEANRAAASRPNVPAGRK